ncbi:MAG: ABC transporter permease [Blastocatellia bacterium]
MQTLWQDLRYAVRMLGKNPGFALAAILTLALGIGVNTTIFSLVNALLLRSLPVEEPNRLARVGSTARGDGFRTFSHQEYAYFRDHNEVFSGLIAHHPINVSLRAGDEAELAWGEIVSGNYFSVLGVRPALGRAFLPEEDATPGARAVAVISHNLWKRSFGADQGVIGKAVRLNGHTFTVVGVAPAGFSGTFVGFAVDLWAPVMMSAQVAPSGESLQRWDDRFLMLIGRLRPGATFAQAHSSMTVLAEQLAQAHPDTNKDRGVKLAAASGLHPALTGPVTIFLALLMGVVALVLLIACANVANLLLARATVRRKEIAIRLALGAGRFRLVRQLLTENVLLALLGGVAGGLLAFWTSDLLTAFRPPTDVPIVFNLSLDQRVFAFNFLLALLTGIVFGLAPALAASRPDVMTALKDETAGDARRSRLRDALVVVQVAVSLVLLIGAGLLARSLRQAATMEVGFDPQNVFVMAFEPQLLGYDPPRARAFYQELTGRVSSLPGVRGVTLAHAVPLGDRGGATDFLIEGQPPPPGQAAGQATLSADYNVVAPGYFETVRIPLTQGREFVARDREGAPGVVIINETFARRFWPGENPLGKRLRRANLRIWGDQGPLLEVVGVARDIKYRSYGEPPRPYLYVPQTQDQRLDLMLHVRTAGDPRAALEATRSVVRQLDDNMPITGARLMTESMGFSLLPARLAGSVLGVAGLLALVLAATGIFGVISYAVSRRTREIGIRMALGARPRDVLKLVIRQGMVLTLIGVVIGLAGALGLMRLLSGLLYGVSAADPLTFVSIASLLTFVALLACWIPARRATKVDPMIALRRE